MTARDDDLLQGLSPELFDAFASVADVLDPVAAPAGARERLVAAALSGGRRFAPFVPALEELFDLGAEAVTAILERAASAASWVAGPLPGVEVLHLAGGKRVAGADCGLTRLAAGTPFPDHGHLGNEVVLLLQGGYVDTSGESYHPGDLHEMQPGARHGYVVLPDEPCVVAVVSFGGIEIDSQVFKIGR